MTWLDNKIILITGAGGGIGSELTLQLTKRNVRLILTDKEVISNTGISNQERIIGQFTADLSQEDGCQQVFQQAKAISPRIDILINNAGIAVMGGFLAVPQEKWQQLLAINLHAPIHLSRLFLPAMIEHECGHIVNISSMAGHFAHKDLNYYSISKFGLRAMGEALHAELVGSGVAISNVYPFFTDTGILASKQYNKRKKQIPSLFVERVEDVVADIIRGIEKKELHIFPGLYARGLNLVQQIFPGLRSFLSRGMN